MSDKRYSPIENELSVEVAFVQAAHVLDAAVELAIESKDTERLQSLALTWMELGLRMLSGAEDDDDDEDEEDESGTKYMRLGFSQAERVVEE